MKILQILFLISVFFCSCSKKKPISAYEGTWETPPLNELVEKAFIEEIIPAIREGNFHPFAELAKEEPEEFKDLLKKSDEEIAEELLSDNIIAGFSFVKTGFTIMPDSRHITYAIIKGEKTITSDEKVDYEVTDREILVRSNEETEVIYIEDNHLKMRNEETGNYPSFLTFYRVPQNNTSSKPLQNTDNSEIFIGETIIEVEAKGSDKFFIPSFSYSGKSVGEKYPNIATTGYSSNRTGFEYEAKKPFSVTISATGYKSEVVTIDETSPKEVKVILQKE